MTSRSNHFWLAGALSSATYLTLSSAAFAQDTEPLSAETQDVAPDQGSEPAPATEGALDPAPASEEPAEEPPPAPPAEAAAQPRVTAAPKPKQEGGAKAGWPVKQLSIVQTPWTAYPSQQIRGLTYGSLWRTFHGQQWPYMPKSEETDEPTFQIAWSGGIWNDLSFTHIDVDPSRAEADQNRWNTQTRATLRMTPTLNIKSDWFVQGNAELVV